MKPPDKDFQILKINIAWDYYLGRSLAWTAIFSGSLIGAISIIFQAGSLLGFPFTIFLSILAVGMAVWIYWNKVVFRFEGRLDYVDELIEKAEEGGQLGNLHDIMNEIKKRRKKIRQ
jgi:hypothetical protein